MSKLLTLIYWNLYRQSWWIDDITIVNHKFYKLTVIYSHQIKCIKYRDSLPETSDLFLFSPILKVVNNLETFSFVSTIWKINVLVCLLSLSLDYFIIILLI